MFKICYSWQQALNIQVLKSIYLHNCNAQEAHKKVSSIIRTMNSAM